MHVATLARRKMPTSQLLKHGTSRAKHKLVQSKNSYIGFHSVPILVPCPRANERTCTTMALLVLSHPCFLKSVPQWKFHVACCTGLTSIARSAYQEYNLSMRQTPIKMEYCLASTAQGYKFTELNLEIQTDTFGYFQWTTTNNFQKYNIFYLLLLASSRTVVHLKPSPSVCNPMASTAFMRRGYTNWGGCCHLFFWLQDWYRSVPLRYKHLADFSSIKSTLTRPNFML